MKYEGYKIGPVIRDIRKDKGLLIEEVKKRRSVIKRLREKQIAIAVKSGKPIPKYLDQEIERRRR